MPGKQTIASHQTIVHPTAVVAPTARLGSGSQVGPYALIEEEVAIGERCWIGAHAVIKPYTSMGEDNRVFEGAILGGIPQDLKYSGEISYLRVGNRNTFREGVTVHRASDLEGETRIGNDNYFMGNVHVAHNCLLEGNVVLTNNIALAGHVHVEDHAFVSAGVVIHQFTQLGRHCMIGGNSKITQDVLPFFLTDGVPARVRGLNLVGLKRNGFSNQEISNLKRAYRILFQRGLKRKEKLTAMREIDSEHVFHLVSFIERSKRGFCGAEKKR